jgi:hypothetical protein
MEGVASYALNVHAVAHARRLIDAHQYVLESVWGDVQPTADDENAFLESHAWDDYGAWHLGLTDVPTTTPRPDTHSCMGTFGASIGSA